MIGSKKSHKWYIRYRLSKLHNLLNNSFALSLVSMLNKLLEIYYYSANVHNNPIRLSLIFLIQLKRANHLTSNTFNNLWNYNDFILNHSFKFKSLFEDLEKNEYNCFISSSKCMKHLYPSSLSNRDFRHKFNKWPKFKIIIML